MLKNLMPSSLFGRSLIIIVTPVVLLQVVSAVVFYDRHLETVARRMSRAVAGDISFLISSMTQFPGDEARDTFLDGARRYMNMNVALVADAKLPPGVESVAATPLEQVLFRTLEIGIRRPFVVEPHPEFEAYRLRVQVDDGLLVVLVPQNRFTTSTAHIFFFWMVGSALLLLTIAILFLRNQVRPIGRLADAADRFGKGQEVDDFKPAGAAEVRQAAAAFIKMAERIQRQIRQRTEMLAGVSHDLRTPLTRMKLALEMVGDRPEAADIKADVEEMERMVDGYLSFARGADGESAVDTDVGALLNEIAERARRNGATVELDTDGDMIMPVKQQALKRCVTNLVDNAGRYAERTRVTARRLSDSILITVDDDGPGIPPAERAAVFRPFYRLEDSRNRETGGIGLGLAIARDTIRSHGGDVTLDTSPDGGLRALVRLPV